VLMTWLLPGLLVLVVMVLATGLFGMWWVTGDDYQGLHLPGPRPHRGHHRGRAGRPGKVRGRAPVDYEEATVQIEVDR